MESLSNLTKDELRSIRKKLNIGTIASLCGMIGCSFTGNALDTPFYYVALCSYWTLFCSSKFVERKFLFAPSCEEDKELIKIYKEILDDIVKLSKDLDNTSVMEHNQLLSDLLIHKYLTYDLKGGSYLKFNENSAICSSLSLNGHGVCRHYSSMQKDYFSKLGYPSYVHIGHIGKVFDDNEYKLVSALVANGFLDKSYLENSNDKPAFDLNLYKEFSTLVRKNGVIPNHAICQVNDKDFSYYLDIAQDDFYIKNGEELKGTLFNQFLIDELMTKKLNKSFYASRKIKVLDSKPFENLRMEQLNAEKKIIENHDMLMKLHNDNKDKLEEAEHVYQKIIAKK